MQTNKVHNTYTPAHYQSVVLAEALRLWYPEHEPREQDPYYKLFHQAKKKMKTLDIPCWRCGVHYADLVKRNTPGTEKNPLGATQLEAHHQDVEFSLANAVDVERWWESSRSQENRDTWFVREYSDLDGFLNAHPELNSDNHEEVFRAFVESEGNLQQLCDVCHRSKHQGVHHIPYPDWRSLGIWKDNLPQHIT